MPKGASEIIATLVWQHGYSVADAGRIVGCLPGHAKVRMRGQVSQARARMPMGIHEWSSIASTRANLPLAMFQAKRNNPQQYKRLYEKHAITDYNVDLRAMSNYCAHLATRLGGDSALR